MKLVKLNVYSCGDRDRGCSWAGSTKLITTTKVKFSLKLAA